MGSVAGTQSSCGATTAAGPSGSTAGSREHRYRASPDCQYRPCPPPTRRPDRERSIVPVRSRPPTHWMGQVTASGYLSASQCASGACVSYNQGKPPSYGTAGGIGAGNSFGPLPGAAQNVGAANDSAPRGGSEFGSGQLAWRAPRGDARVGQANSFGGTRLGWFFQRAAATSMFQLCMWIDGDKVTQCIPAGISEQFGKSPIFVTLLAVSFAAFSCSV